MLSRLREIGDEYLALVFPPDSIIFRNLSEVKFFKEELGHLDKKIVIVTSDKGQEELARSLGLTVKEEFSGQGEEEFLEKFYNSKDKKGKKLPEEPSKSEQQPEKVKEEQRIHVEQEPDSKEVKAPDQLPPKEVHKKEPIMFDDVISPAETTSPSAAEVTAEPGATPAQKDTAEPLKQPDRSKPAAPLWQRGGAAEKTRPAARKKGIKRILGSGILWLGLGAVGVLVVVLLFFFPKAKVVVTPRIDDIQLEMEMTLDTASQEVNTETGVVPAQIFSTELSLTRSFQATGVSGEIRSSRGEITIFNTFSTEPQTLIARTRFESPEGKIFRIQKAVTVPGATKKPDGSLEPGRLSVEVVADKPGAEYNIDPTKFTIPGFAGSPRFDKFWAESAQKFSGGGEGEALVVSSQDVESARQAMESALKKSLTSAIQQRLGDNFVLVTPSIEVEFGEGGPEPGVDAAAELFDYTLSGKAKGFAYLGQQADQLFNAKLQPLLTDKRTAVDSTRSLTFEIIEQNFESGIGRYKTTLDQKAIWRVDKQKLAAELAGKSETEAKSLLENLQEVTGAEFTIWALGSKSRLPSNPDRIDVVISSKLN